MAITHSTIERDLIDTVSTVSAPFARKLAVKVFQNDERYDEIRNMPRDLDLVGVRHPWTVGAGGCDMCCDVITCVDVCEKPTPHPLHSCNNFEHSVIVTRREAKAL